MAYLSLGIFGTSRKENEHRLPVHPRHLPEIDADVRQRIFLELGYGQRFGVSDAELTPLVGGLRTREWLMAECDVALLPKPVQTDVDQLPPGCVLWGWPHSVQNVALTQSAIDAHMTLIAWESMNRWLADGGFNGHVFAKNNELAGYCAVLHAMQLVGLTGSYGRPLRAAVISYGATAHGAVTALTAMGVSDVTILTQRAVAAVTPPSPNVPIVHMERVAAEPGRVRVVLDNETPPVASLLATADIVVNCVLQDPDAPLMFITTEELARFPTGCLFVDVSCDAGMGFEWASPTTFLEPMVGLPGGKHYYSVDHTPSFLWDSSTWEISRALLPYVRTVMSGPEAWAQDDTIRRAIEVRDGEVLNPKILSFQNRALEHPHPHLMI